MNESLTKQLFSNDKASRHLESRVSDLADSLEQSKQESQVLKTKYAEAKEEA